MIPASPYELVLLGGFNVSAFGGVLVDQDEVLLLGGLSVSGEINPTLPPRTVIGRGKALSAPVPQAKTY